MTIQELYDSLKLYIDVEVSKIKVEINESADLSLSTRLENFETVFMHDHSGMVPLRHEVFRKFLKELRKVPVLSEVVTINTFQADTIAEFDTVTEHNVYIISGVMSGFLTVVRNGLIVRQIYVSKNGDVFTREFDVRAIGTFPSFVNINMNVDGSNSLISSLQFVINEAYVQPTEGEIKYNQTEKCFEVGEGNGSSTSVGFEHKVRYTATPSGVSDGVILMYGGTVGGSGNIAGKLAVNGQYREFLLGVSANPTGLNQDGSATILGKNTADRVNGYGTEGVGVEGLNWERWVVNDKLYLHPSIPGQFTKFKPSAGRNKMIQAIVLKSNPNRITLLVNIKDSIYMDDITDFADGNSSHGDIITFNESTGFWETGKFLDGDYQVNGLLNVSQMQAGHIDAHSVTTQGDIVSHGAVNADSAIESGVGFIKTGSGNSEILLGGGGSLPISELKAGIYQLYNPANDTQVVLSINAAGQVLIEGDIIHNGSSYETHAENINTPQSKITLRDNATAGLNIGELAGFLIKKYDGVNDGMIVVDKDGVLRIGDVGSLQPVATREESPIAESPMFWDDSAKRLKTLSGSTIKTNSLADLDKFIIKDSQDNDKPKWLTAEKLKEVIKDDIGSEFLFYLSDDDSSVLVGIGSEVFVSEGTVGYPSVIINVATL